MVFVSWILVRPFLRLRKKRSINQLIVTIDSLFILIFGFILLFFSLSAFKQYYLQFLGHFAPLFFRAPPERRHGGRERQPQGPGQEEMMLRESLINLIRETVRRILAEERRNLPPQEMDNLIRDLISGAENDPVELHRIYSTLSAEVVRRLLSGRQ